jgi:hypothetical protein
MTQIFRNILENLNNRKFTFLCIGYDFKIIGKLVLQKLMSSALSHILSS